MRRLLLVAVLSLVGLVLFTPSCETGDVCEPYCTLFCTDVAECADGSKPAGGVLDACIVTCVDYMKEAGAQVDHEECTDTFAEETLGLFRDDFEC